MSEYDYNDEELAADRELIQQFERALKEGICASCRKPVAVAERFGADGKLYHKQCVLCSAQLKDGACGKLASPEVLGIVNGKFYCGYHTPSDEHIEVEGLYKILVCNGCFNPIYPGNLVQYTGERGASTEFKFSCSQCGGAVSSRTGNIDEGKCYCLRHVPREAENPNEKMNDLVYACFKDSNLHHKDCNLTSKANASPPSITVTDNSERKVRTGKTRQNVFHEQKAMTRAALNLGRVQFKYE